MSRPLGCLTRSGLLAGAITTLLVVAAALVSHNAIFSPGALRALAGSPKQAGTSSHADIAGCDACHTAFWGSEAMSDRCIACHGEIQLEMEDPRSMHGGLGDPRACQACHTEHGGPDASLIRYDNTDFPHSMTGFALTAHSQTKAERTIACSSCHGDPASTFQPEVCATCHQDLDGERFAAHMHWAGQECLACHDGVDRYGGDFHHSDTGYPLLGAHVEADCSGCHAQAVSVAALQATPGECTACHADDDVHAGALGEDCGSCHRPDVWKEAQFDHQLTRFPLLGAHQGVVCQGCHVDARFSGTPMTCVQCHAADDAHAGQLGEDCVRCHSETSWGEVTLNHELTSFPLEGAHRDAACEGCHLEGVFVGTSTECVDCHLGEDTHQGGFGTYCGACHHPTEWQDITFDHQRSDFPLTGAHQSIACVECHEGAVFQPTSTACSACHGEPSYHAGLFTSDCAACHSTRAWRPAQFNLAHSFPMGHKGAGGNCALCHPSTLANYTCYGCHEHRKSKIREEHEGVSNLANCVRCHPKGREGGD